MATKPSQRRNYKDANMELNLTPMMNLITILIPTLLVSVAFVELAIINVSAPAIGQASEAEEPPDPEKKPLNLTITITDKGYTLAGSEAVLPPAGDQAGPTFPVLKKTVSCATYVNTVPPPRAKNEPLGACSAAEAESGATKSFFVYDHTALREKLIGLKEAFPDEKRVIIAAEPGTTYEAITETMDASRSYKGDDEKEVILFDEVILSPGLG